MTLTVQSDDHFMNLAILEAQKARDADEVPVGAVVVCDGQVIARGHNLTETLNDVTAHAEMQVITMSSNYLGGKFLDQCTLYVTLEPCSMCAGALYWSRFKKVVIGAKDEKRGFTAYNEKMLHPKTEIIWGIKEQECSQILKDFFQQKRG